MFLIFRECQPWIDLSLFLTFSEIWGSCFCKIVFIKKECNTKTVISSSHQVFIIPKRFCSLNAVVVLMWCPSLKATTSVQSSDWNNTEVSKPTKSNGLSNYVKVTYSENVSPFLGSINLRYPLPAVIYLLKVNNKNTRTKCEICSKLTIKTPERRHWRRFGVFIVNFEHISHLFQVFPLLTLNM